MAPFVLNRLKNCRGAMEKHGHQIRFTVARGPLNIASFLMGTTEFLIGLRSEPDKIHQLLEIITCYLTDWLRLQKQSFDTIDGIFILDDIVGFCGQPDFVEFASPYLSRVFNAFPASVRFFHNDADGRVCAPYLPQIGVNLFNFSFLHSLSEMKMWTKNQVVLVGNIPPRDTLALCSPQEIAAQTRLALDSVEDTSRILLSAGGGMPDGVDSQQIRAFIDAVQIGERQI